MLIPIKSEGCSFPEWAIIELQGSLEVQEAAKQHISDLQIGSLKSTSNGKLCFTVGYHELEGQVVTLKKPLVILTKHVETADVSAPSVSHDKISTQALQLPGVSYLARGVIRQKYIFKGRPRALITKQEPKTKKSRSSSLQEEDASAS
eukprot:jgi/Mesen1/4587/ME000232S03850